MGKTALYLDTKHRAVFQLQGNMLITAPLIYFFTVFPQICYNLCNYSYK